MKCESCSRYEVVCIPKVMTCISTCQHFIPKHPLAPLFPLVTAEYERSLREHKPWDNHSYRAMLAIIQGEVTEVGIAVELGDEADMEKECIHTASSALKMALEIRRRRNVG